MTERNTRVRPGQIRSITKDDLDTLAEPLDGQVLSYNESTDRFEWVTNVAGASSSQSVDKIITQASHGFIVGNVLRFNGTVYLKAQANSASNAINTLGLVAEVIDINTFRLRTIGYVDGLSGLVSGRTYFLSDTVAGELTLVEPTATGSVNKPLFIAVSTTSGFIFNFNTTTSVIFSLMSRNSDGDLQPIDDFFGQIGLSEIDSNEALQPISETINDTLIEVDENDDIEPKL